MDPLASSAAATTIAPAPPPPAPSPAPADQSPAPVAAKGRAFDTGLLNGQGNKTGILKRMGTEEIETVQAELGVKARETAASIVAERAAEAVTTDPAATEADSTDAATGAVATGSVPTDEAATDPTRIEIPLTEPVQTVPVKAANVEPQTAGIAFPEPPAIPFEVPSFTTDDPSGVTSFVLSAGITASGED